MRKSANSPWEWRPKNPYIKRSLIILPTELWKYIYDQAKEQKISQSRWMVLAILGFLGDKAPACDRFNQFILENPTSPPGQLLAKSNYEESLYKLRKHVEKVKRISRTQVADFLDVSTKTASRVIHDMVAFWPDNAEVSYEGQGNKLYLQWKD